MSVERARELVAKGAAWLDEREPHWHKLIDLGKFNIANGCHCILGQAGANLVGVEAVQKALAEDYTPYYVVCDEYGIAPQNYGFVSSGHAEVNELQEAWVEEIRYREATS